MQGGEPLMHIHGDHPQALTLQVGPPTFWRRMRAA